MRTLFLLRRLVRSRRPTPLAGYPILDETSHASGPFTEHAKTHETHETGFIGDRRKGTFKTGRGCSRGRQRDHDRPARRDAVFRRACGPDRQGERTAFLSEAVRHCGQGRPPGGALRMGARVELHALGTEGAAADRYGARPGLDQFGVAGPLRRPEEPRRSGPIVPRSRRAAPWHYRLSRRSAAVRTDSASSGVSPSPDARPASGPVAHAIHWAPCTSGSTCRGPRTRPRSSQPAGMVATASSQHSERSFDAMAPL